MSEETMAITLPVSRDGLSADRFLDRELSWLAFNRRVLELAQDPTMHLLERVNFLSIFSSNLDEFFMVRVAGLKRRLATGLAVKSPSGLSPKEVLTKISEEAHELQLAHAKLFLEVIEPELEKHGINLVRWNELRDDEKLSLQDYFQSHIFPVLTPLAVDPAHPFPYISGLSLNLAVVLQNPGTEKEHFARVKVPPLLPRFVLIPNPDKNEGVRYVPLEDIIGEFLGLLFPGMTVLQYHNFRVTRNEDLEVDEDEGENLLLALEKELLRRRFGPPVRLEVADDMNPQVLELLIRELDISMQDVYTLPSPLDLTGLSDIGSLPRPELRFPPHSVVTNRHLVPRDDEPLNMFTVLKSREVLVHHPYESFSTSVQEFLEQAAEDPQVLAIKQTLYRTSGDSPVVDALIQAAQAGKQVLALVEIKARFDEQNNITWARKLEQAGVHVVYGMVGLKTHCKLALVIRQEAGSLVRYCHIGTGNYNPKTARFYEDYGLLTSRESVGEDLTKLFNHLSGYAPEATFKSLLVSPVGVREGLTDLIEQEIQLHKAGKKARISIKVNALVDEEIIDSLYKASNAGVPIDILVRGMCALKPGVPGLSETIRVRSILGRYLEHSRIFSFIGGGDPKVYLGSADMMHRNLDRRVEVLVRLSEPEHVNSITEMFELAMSEQISSWALDSSGNWVRSQFDSEGNTLSDFQDTIMKSIAEPRGK
ncbi:MAG: RNA degradosome polyphosphate kinase [Actinobacteria bacterium]|uniref:ATP-polyphosphate phosphotransferase n=1 Tax=freshwater metagenome TaxID=449393 RepID=A0A6J6J344_9ZZZZ|nr:RNA degradosome polyphosphate kinase [Actinomycetota bacterium]